MDTSVLDPTTETSDDRPPVLRSRPRRIAVVASLTWSLVNFRLELLRAMVARGHEVTALAPDEDPLVSRRLAEIGVGFRTVPMARAGMNPLQDAATLTHLVRTLRDLRIDCLVTYTMKPVVYGGIAGRIAGVRERHALMTGLGYLFADEPAEAGTKAAWRRRAMRALGARLYRSGLHGSGRVFVYNEADIADIRRHRMVANASRLVPVPGSGVDLDHFEAAPVPGGEPVFLMVARLLGDKGVREFVQAAKRLRAEGHAARFRLLGPLDPNPNGISAEEVEGWRRSGAVEVLEETRDVRPHLRAAHVFVLPTYYREGIPRSLLEALATGRPIVTTDMAGCRATVEEGVNGHLVRPRDANHLTDTLRRLIVEPDRAARLARMGRCSRARAERTFDVHRVNALLLDGMGL